MKGKNVLLLSTNDSKGAGDAIVKIAEILISMSFNVCMVVQEKSGNEDFVKRIPKGTYMVQNFSKRIFNRLKHIIIKEKPLDINNKYLFLSQNESNNNINVKLFLNKIDFVPPKEIIKQWESDYTAMQENMIYGKSESFKKLIENIVDLRERFRKIKI